MDFRLTSFSGVQRQLGPKTLARMRVILSFSSGRVGAQEGTPTLVIITSTLPYQSDFALVVFHRSKQIEAMLGNKNKVLGTSMT
jgi:hypothetical protein